MLQHAPKAKSPTATPAEVVEAWIDSKRKAGEWVECDPQVTPKPRAVREPSIWDDWGKINTPTLIWRHIEEIGPVATATIKNKILAKQVRHHCYKLEKSGQLVRVQVLITDSKGRVVSVTAWDKA